jgi:hypothetical protein
LSSDTEIHKKDTASEIFPDAAVVLLTISAVVISHPGIAERCVAVRWLIPDDVDP